MHQRADNGRQHSGLGQEHSAARRLRMAHRLQAEHEEDRREQIGGFDEVGRRAHLRTTFSCWRFWNIFSMRSVIPNPPTTLMVEVVTARNPSMVLSRV